jgi:hypothetical protein
LRLVAFHGAISARLQLAFRWYRSRAPRTNQAKRCAARGRGRLHMDTGFVWLESPSGIGALLEPGVIMVGKWCKPQSKPAWRRPRFATVRPREPLNKPHADCVASKMRMDARRAPKVVVRTTMPRRLSWQLRTQTPHFAATRSDGGFAGGPRCRQARK